VNDNRPGQPDAGRLTLDQVPHPCACPDLARCPALSRSATCRRAVLDRSSERDRWLSRLLDAWRQGYAAGAAGQFDAGYAAAIADVKAAQHALPDHLNGQHEAQERRWVLRGETRTRATFAGTHPADRIPRKRDVS